MDVSKWPLNKIMQLPDGCFGPRWFVGVGENPSGTLAVFDISEMPLPDVCVVWAIIITGSLDVGQVGMVNLRLGDQLPVLIPLFNTYEVLFPGYVSGFGVSGTFVVSQSQALVIPNVRKVVHAQGRRLVGYFTAVGAIPTIQLSAAILVSGIPKEVPDCFLA